MSPVPSNPSPKPAAGPWGRGSRGRTGERKTGRPAGSGCRGGWGQKRLSHPPPVGAAPRRGCRCISQGPSRTPSSHSPPANAARRRGCQVHQPDPAAATSRGPSFCRCPRWGDAGMVVSMAWLLVGVGRSQRQQHHQCRMMRRRNRKWRRHTRASVSATQQVGAAAAGSKVMLAYPERSGGAQPGMQWRQRWQRQQQCQTDRGAMRWCVMATERMVWGAPSAEVEASSRALRRSLAGG